jgi:hypothetical protein
MQTAGVTIDSGPGIAIYLTKAVTYTSYTVQAINKAVRASGLGKTQDKRPYLKNGCSDGLIVRDVNSIRQSGVVLSLRDPRWPAKLVNQLKRGWL